MNRQSAAVAREVTIEAPDAALPGTLSLPPGARGIVLFAHGSGSSRFSPRNRSVAEWLNDGGLGTLLFDLLTPDEHQIDQETAEFRFDIELLSRRLAEAVEWVQRQPELKRLRIGLFGASTGAAAALNVAARMPEAVAAVVSRGGRPDLAGHPEAVSAPTLLIVGGRDDRVLRLNREAAAQLDGENHVAIVPGATHLFEENGALERVAQLARDWFKRHLER